MIAQLTPAEILSSLESEDALAAGALGFMPRLFVLTTLPHRRPQSHQFERVNGRHSLRMTAPRRVGLPYGSYPRLPSILRLARGLIQRRAPWRSKVVLGQDFFAEITRAAVPIDLRALHFLKTSPLAIDLYIWLTYRMSYLKKLTLIPWGSLQAQFGAKYCRPRDFRRSARTQLGSVLRAYPGARIAQNEVGLRLYPSAPHVRSRSL